MKRMGVFALLLLAAWSPAQKPASTAAAGQAVQQAVQNGAGSVGGMVVNGKTGLPVAGAAVTLVSLSKSGQEQSTAADSEGRFLFTAVAGGRYRLQAARRGYIAAAYEEHPGGFYTALVVDEKLATTGLKLTLLPQAALRGNVTDDFGDPVTNGTVHLFEKSRSGTGKMTSVNSESTNGAGDYELVDLAPGSYYVCVVATPWYVEPGFGIFDGAAAEQGDTPSAVDKAYPVTCSPGVTDQSLAEPVEVAAGDRVTVNFTLQTVAAAHISYQLPAAYYGVATPRFTVNILGVETRLLPAFSNFFGQSPTAPDMVTPEAKGLAPGTYTARFRDPFKESEQSVTIEAAAGANTIERSASAGLGVELMAKLVISDGAAAPSGATALLVNSDNEIKGSAKLYPDGAFYFLSGVTPGAYRIQIRVPDASLQVVKTVIDGVESSGGAVTVAGEPLTLTVVAARSEASVRGKALRNGRPASGVLVLLVPNGAGQNDERLRAAQSASDGSFILPYAIAGAYTLVAIQDGWTLDWERPEAIASYLRKGKKIAVRPDSKELVLDEPVEAQPK